MTYILRDIIVPTSRMVLASAEKMIAAIPEELFYRKPQLSTGLLESNHAGFCFGHLSLYPFRFIEPLKLPLSRLSENYVKLFASGALCLDDKEAATYPPIMEVIEKFRFGHSAIIEAIGSFSDEQLLVPNPNEKMRERLPTLGLALTYIFGPHMTSHLGQISAWRRAFGLTPI